MMEKNSEKTTGVKEKKIKVFAGVSHHIFLECFKKIGILTAGKFDENEWSLKLRSRLQQDLPEYDKITDFWLTYHNYLRDKYNIVCKIIEDGNPKRLIGYEAFRFQPLLTFLEIDDYKKLNDEFSQRFAISPVPVAEPEKATVLLPGNLGVITENQPIKIPVLYSPKPYSFMNILRNPENGLLYFYNNGDIVFTGEKSIHIQNGNLKNAGIHIMHGIPAAPWVKIAYEQQGQECTAFFVEVSAENKGSALEAPQKILDHFTERVQA